MDQSEGVLLEADDIARMVRRMATEILEQVPSTASLGLVGIRRGGEPLARRLAASILELESRTVPVGCVDITLYRDDAASSLPDPKIGPSEIDFDIEGRDIVLVDDVLQSGRTVRAAIDCLFDFGRPRRVWLAVLCDRGGRELPVAPDFVGRIVRVRERDIIEVSANGGPGDHVIVRKSLRPEASA